MSSMRADSNHLFIIGAQRCGTSLLRDLLDTHPAIEMARPFRPESKWFLDPAHRDLAEFVERHFDRAANPLWRGEKATSYIERPGAARRIEAAVPDARIVAVLRSPIDRAVSNYRFSVSHGIESRPIDIALDPSSPSPRWDSSRFSVSPYSYLERGRYLEHLRPWLDGFGHAVKILMFEDLIAGTAEADLLGWLGLPRRSGSAPPSTVNASAAGGEQPSTHVLTRLRHYFAEANEALSNAIERDLSNWNDLENGTSQ